MVMDSSDELEPWQLTRQKKMQRLDLEIVPDLRHADAILLLLLMQ